jgi:hypothetical protein
VVAELRALSAEREEEKEAIRGEGGADRGGGTDGEGELARVGAALGEALRRAAAGEEAAEEARREVEELRAKTRALTENVRLVKEFLQSKTAEFEAELNFLQNRVVAETARAEAAAEEAARRERELGLKIKAKNKKMAEMLWALFASRKTNYAAPKISLAGALGDPPAARERMGHFGRGDAFGEFGSVSSTAIGLVLNG